MSGDVMLSQYIMVKNNINTFIIISREIIETSRKALHLLKQEHPKFKPTLSVIQVRQK